MDGDHPEFASRFDKDNSCPNYLKAANENHGTAVASKLVAEGDNDVCAVGIAPGATLSACSNAVYNLEKEDDILLYKIEAVDISSNSWGPMPCYNTYFNDDDGWDDDDGWRRQRRGRRLQCSFTYDHADSPCNVCGDVMDTSNPDCRESIMHHCSYFYDLDSTACLEYLDLFVDCQYHVIELPIQQAFHKAITEGRGGKGVIFGMFNQ